MSEAALCIRNLTVRYGENTALEEVCLELREGAYMAVMGPNGGGKSTLLKAVLGLVRAEAGEIRICGENAARARGRCGYVPQFALMDRRFPISVEEAALTGRLPGGLHPFFRYGEADKKAALRAMEELGVAHLAKRQVGELSGGEFQRLLLARALAAKPALLLLDEPTASIDPASRAQIYALLDKLHKSGMSIMMVTHDLMAVASSVDALACLHTRLVYHGEPALNEEVLGQMYGCPVDLIAHGVPHRVLGSHGEGGCAHA